MGHGIRGGRPVTVRELPHGVGVFREAGAYVAVGPGRSRSWQWPRRAGPAGRRAGRRGRGRRARARRGPGCRGEEAGARTRAGPRLRRTRRRGRANPGVPSRSPGTGRSSRAAVSGFDAGPPAVPDTPPHRSAGGQEVLGRRVLARCRARRVRAGGAAALRVLRRDRANRRVRPPVAQPADSAAWGLRTPIVTRAMMTMPRAMRYQTKGMKLLVEMNFMNQAMTA